MDRLSETPALFENFIGRDEDLRRVTRFSICPVMFYRTNLYTHSHRVASLVRAINPEAVAAFGVVYDPNKAELLAYVHDDAEIIFGDVQAGNKSKMTREQLRAVEEAEERAIEEITMRFPELIDGYSYEQLLREAANKSSLEAQVVSYADKRDALGEVLHEVFAGNHTFAQGIFNEFGHIPPPTDFYINYIQSFATKFPALRPLLTRPFSLFQPVPHRDYSAITATGVPHTQDSVYVPTDDDHYNIWKDIILADAIDEVREALYVQREYLTG